ncbi:MAG: hypothetical protein HS116_21175 [Planctomycetes bacterium]|nr:hypothetical protein [Planctomycetota bacterium]
MPTIPPGLPACMAAEARKHGWPICWDSDLRIDAEWIQKEQIGKFVWVLRNYGTHLICPWTDKDCPQYLRALVRAFGDTRESGRMTERMKITLPWAHVYIYERSNLREVTFDQAYDWLSEVSAQIQAGLEAALKQSAEVLE